MILEIDIGNTRAKWRLLGSGAKVIAAGSDDVSTWVTGNLPGEWRAGLRRVRIASVRGEEIVAALVDALERHCEVVAEVASVSKTCGDVENAYADPAMMGVDRWLALVAAYSEIKSAALIVDAGSAVTIDLVNAQGVHQGGFIIPGPRLMREVLTSSTDRIRFDADAWNVSLAFGQSTSACVLNGVVLAMAGAVALAGVEARKMLGVEPTLFLTGGYAPELMRLPQFGRASYRPDLVMDGLRYVLP